VRTTLELDFNEVTLLLAALEEKLGKSTDQEESTILENMITYIKEVL
jgi:hypothetical protein